MSGPIIIDRKIFIGGLVLVLLMTLVNLVVSLDAVREREISRKERKEIICILKILPQDRQAHPEKVEACK